MIIIQKYYHKVKIFFFKNINFHIVDYNFIYACKEPITSKNLLIKKNSSKKNPILKKKNLLSNIQKKQNVIKLIIS